MARSTPSPGFRFHPTDVELVMYYLKRKLLGKRLIFDALAEVNIYDFSPWDLPDKSNLRSRDLEWFFFCPKSRKYSSGSKTNRATKIGYWKATGKDRPVKYKQKPVAMIKKMVFHIGHPPKGQRTNWVMHEYRMDDKDMANAGVVQDTCVLCRIFEKSGAGPKNGAQYGAPFNEEESDDDDVVGSSEPSAVAGLCGATKTCGRSLTEPGSSTVVSSVNERHIDVPVNDDMLTNEGNASILGGLTTKRMNCKQKSPATTKMLVPQNACIRSLNEPGSSTVALSANERCNDDDMLTGEDIASILEGLDNQVENLSEKKTIDEDNRIYEDLTNLIDLQDLKDDGAVNMFNGVDYTPDDLFTADDLDVNLRRFYVG